MTVLVGLFMAVALYSLSSCRGTEKTISKAAAHGGPRAHSCPWGRGWPLEKTSVVPNSSLPPCNRITHPYFLHVTSHKRRQSVFLCLVDAEFVHESCFGPWNILEDMMQVEALQALAEFAGPLVLLPSARTGLNLGNSWFQNEKHVGKTLT